MPGSHDIETNSRGGIHPAYRPPRLGLWLVWTARLLIAWPLVVVLVYVHNLFQLTPRITEDSGYYVPILPHSIRYVAAWLCLPIAGLTLLYWRRAMGLRLACGLIWLAPLVSLSDLLLGRYLRIDGPLTLSHFILMVLKCGFFHAVGFSAFLLGNARICDAYGLVFTGFRRETVTMPAGVLAPARLATDTPATDALAAGSIATATMSATSGGAGTGGFQASWLGVFCWLLLTPCLVLVPSINQHVIGGSRYWQAHPQSWQIVCAGFAALPLTAAICLSKYHRAGSITAAILVLWLLAASPVLLRLLSHSDALIAGWPSLAALPPDFGFDLLAAFAWTAYLRTAPRIQHIYIGQSAGAIDVDIF